MDRMSFDEKPGFLRDTLSAWGAATNGVTSKTSRERQKYWRHWCSYASAARIDPYLAPATVTPLERDIVAGAFAARVRSGRYGRGRQIKVGGVADALAAISKTIELAGQPSQLYRAENKYQLHLERVMEGFRREDPPAVPQLAVPVTVAKHAFRSGLLTKSPEQRHVGSLILVAFYYLLRVGEYTKPPLVTVAGKRVRATRTVQFSVGNVGFFRNGRIIPRSSPLKDLLRADLATLKISNQKNGRMGQTISHHITGTKVCPVRALAAIVHHILSHGGSDAHPIASYHSKGRWYEVTPTQIIKRVRGVVAELHLEKHGIDPDLVGAHSLRAGGAMALKLHGIDDTTIMKIGRWTSLTFLQYIHNQIAHLAKDISTKMSIELPFVNVAAIEPSHPSSDLATHST